MAELAIIGGGSAGFLMYAFEMPLAVALFIGFILFCAGKAIK